MDEHDDVGECLKILQDMAKTILDVNIEKQGLTLPQVLFLLEREIIAICLPRHKNQSQAGYSLGIERDLISNRIKKFKLSGNSN